MSYIRKTTIILITMVLCIVSLQIKSKEVSLDYAQSLLDDDDWLTGIWAYDADSAMALYSLFEKVDGKYQVSNCSPRYPITWWTTKIEKQENQVLAWDYFISDNDLVVSPDVSTTYKLLNETKTRMEHGKDGDYYNTLYLIPNNQMLSNTISGCSFRGFITGKEYLKEQLNVQLENKEKFKYFDLLKNLDSLKHFGSEILIKENILQQSTNNYIYTILHLELSYPARSGYCGSSSYEGYLWVEVKNAGISSEITDSWSLLSNNCYDTAGTQAENNNHLLKFKLLHELKDKNQCFQINTLDISQKPEVCSPSKDMKNEN